jgi:protein-S-isoprenylcysteine O-methyltransferase Ste14
MGKLIILLYGVVSYVIFFATFLYAIGFVEHMVVPKAMDTGEVGPVGMSLLINILLCGIFAGQHIIMARQGFKARWTKIVPKAAERSTYVLASSLALILLFAYWRPMMDTIWQVDNETGRAVLIVVSLAGWGLVLLSTFLINHFELFGLTQTWRHFKGQAEAPPKFVTPMLYKYVRHPLYLGFLIAFWATPDMTTGHLLFAVLTTGLIIIGMLLEERDLVGFFGADYEKYKRTVSMIVPLPRKKGAS